MTELILRNAVSEDVPQMAELEKLCFSDPWSEELIRADVVDNNDISTYILAQENEEIIGYIGIWTVKDECQINNVAVHPEHRRKGIGGLLLGTVLAATREAGITYWTLEVRESNQTAIKLYQNAGFSIVGTRP